MPEIPEGAKVPDDHKSKVEGPPESITVEVRGLELVIPSAAMDDWELMDDLANAEANDNAIALAGSLRRLLTDEQRKAAMNECRDPETGRVTIEAGTSFVSDLFEAIKEQNESAPNS